MDDNVSYTYNVNTSKTYSPTLGSVTLGNTTDWNWSYHPYTYWYTSPETKYLYQIFCPKPGCKGKFWAEVEEIKPCPICHSRIKVTDKVSDYEVSVT